MLQPKASFYKYQKLNDEDLPEKIADLIAEQKVIGWFQGRMEFGPRALGSRTIIGDARSAETQKVVLPTRHTMPIHRYFQVLERGPRWVD